MKEAPSLLQLIPDIFFDALAYILPASLRQLQSATEEELSALLPSVLDKAFKCKL